MRRLNEQLLRKMIRQEIHEDRTRRRNSLSALLFEDDEAAAAGSATGGAAEGGTESFMLKGKPVGAPTGTAFTDQTNFAEFTSPENAREVFAQILTGDPSQPIFKAMEFSEKNKETGEDELKKPNVPEIVQWLKDKAKDPGLDELANRIVAIGKKLPSEGIPKKMMPFLPGPPDAEGSVDQLKDALTPGGEYNVDFAESRRHRGNIIMVERWQKLAGILTEKIAPPEPNTFVGMDAKGAKEYMTSGLNDGNPEDDVTTYQEKPQIPAEKAIPTQKNVLLPKTISMAAGGFKNGGDLKAYFSTANEILDGHHRWSASYLNNPASTVSGFGAIDLDKMGGKTDALMHLTAIGNALGNRTKVK